MKTILASLTGYGNDKSTLETAYAAAELFSAHLNCMFVRPDLPTPAEFAMSGLFVRQGLLSERLREIEQNADARAISARKAFDSFCTTRNPVLSDLHESTLGTSVSWHEIRGTDIPDTIDEARYHELAVLGREAVHDVVETDRAGAIAMDCGRPVLIAPPAPRSVFGRKIAIAWKNTPEAARAVAVAAPFLQKASQIVVITVCENASNDAATKASGRHLAESLKWSGYNVETRHAAKSLHPASLSLLNETYASSADMLVMGAYGHSRFREIVFGGVTRDIMKECGLPVLMFH